MPIAPLLMATSPAFAPSMALLVLVVATDAWVYADARRQRDAGDPVILTIGGLRIETPESWLLACLVLWVIALPLYLTSRRR